MPLFDLPLDELRSYRPEVREPKDFDAFWASTLAESRETGGEGTREPWPGPITELVTEDVTFPGFAGEPIRAWLIRPRQTTGPLPTVVQFPGYGGGRDNPLGHLAWACAGYAQLVMDARGQGSMSGIGGDTPDPHGSHAAYPGFVTKGILDQHDYYYRRLFTDGVRAVDFAASLPEVDATRIATAGGSQGGGIALAVAALHDGVAAAVGDVPFLCHFERALTLTDVTRYSEAQEFLRIHRNAEERVLETLSYFDVVNFAKRIHVPTMVSVGLQDTTCPPSTVFAAINHMPTPPQVEVYKYNDHEGGQLEQLLRAMTWLGERFGVDGG